jgi:hypothetical protein
MAGDTHLVARCNALAPVFDQLQKLWVLERAVVFRKVYCILSLSCGRVMCIV